MCVNMPVLFPVYDSGFLSIDAVSLSFKLFITIMIAVGVFVYSIWCLVLRRIFGTGTTHIHVDTHEASKVLWVLLWALGISVLTLRPILGTIAPHTFTMDRHDVSEVVWVKLCSIGHMLVLPI